MLYARVKAKSPFKTTVACGGITFTKDEYRQVPAHEEAAAKADPLLETTEELPETTAKLVQLPSPVEPANAAKTVKMVRRKPVDTPPAE